MLKYRILTAIVLLLIILSMMWLLPSWLFSLAVSVFFIISAFEWAGLIGLQSLQGRCAYAFLLCLLLLTSYFLNPFPLLIVACIVWLGAGAVVVACQREFKKAFYLDEPWLKGVCGLLMLTACWKAISILQATSPLWLLISLAVCWLADTGAYFSGRWWGKHPLASKISPKKTWEGFWGGLILTVVFFAVLSLLLPMNLGQRVFFIVLITFCVFSSVIGDLFVSLLKRRAGVKDTGTLLPGHGGLLDRGDSALSAVAIFALGFLLLK